MMNGINTTATMMTTKNSATKSSSSSSRRRSRRQSGGDGGGGGRGADADDQSQRQDGKKKTRTHPTRTTTKRKSRAGDDGSSSLWSSYSTSSYSLLSPSVLPAVGILMLAMATGSFWNRWAPEDKLQPPVAPDPRTAAFLNKICNNRRRQQQQQKDDDDSIITCHPHLIPSGRTQATTKLIIRKGETTLRMPRKYQIWDLDALRSNWIRKNGLLKARIRSSSSGTSTTNKPLSSAAFLAAYLAMLLRKQQGHPASGDDDDSFLKNNDVLQDYLSLLPTYKDYATFHPVLWTRQELQNSGLAAPSSSTYEVIVSIRDLLLQEYQALSEASPQVFAKNHISREDYLAARLNVQTRAFGTGPIPIGSTELEYFRNEAGIDLSGGCFAMVPVLDMYDHHANPHVAFEYKQQEQQQQQQTTTTGHNGGGAFVIKAITDIPPNYQVFDSYGKRTDSDLFARYGFVNGDGTDYTEATIALHSIKRNVEGVVDATGNTDRNTIPITRSLLQSPLARQLVHYMQYDDGYEHCVSPKTEDAQAWKFKLLKFKYLLAHSQSENSWVIQFHPRNKDGKPPPSSDYISDPNSGNKKDIEPPSFDPSQQRFNATHIFSTCRLLSLTHRDYNGQATLWLKQHLNDPDAILPQDEKDDALEFRTLLRAAQLASTAQSRFRTSVEEQFQLVARLQQQQQQQQQREDGGGGTQNNSSKTREWAVQYLILGEMQGLQALKQVAFSKLRTLYGHIDIERQAKESSAYHVRERPCLKDLLPLLIEHTIREFE